MPERLALQVLPGQALDGALSQMMCNLCQGNKCRVHDGSKNFILNRVKTLIGLQFASAYMCTEDLLNANYFKQDKEEFLMNRRHSIQCLENLSANKVLGSCTCSYYDYLRVYCIRSLNKCNSPELKPSLFIYLTVLISLCFCRNRVLNEKSIVSYQSIQ